MSAPTADGPANGRIPLMRSQIERIDRDVVAMRDKVSDGMSKLHGRLDAINTRIEVFIAGQRAAQKEREKAKSADRLWRIIPAAFIVIYLLYQALEHGARP